MPPLGMKCLAGRFVLVAPTVTAQCVPEPANQVTFGWRPVWMRLGPLVSLPRKLFLLEFTNLSVGPSIQGPRRHEWHATILLFGRA